MSRRAGSLRHRVAGVLVAAALLAVALFGTLSYFAAHRLLADGARSQLLAIGQTRAQSAQLAVDRLFAGVSSTAQNDGIVRSTEQFVADFAALAGEQLDPAQQAELESAYDREVVTPVNQLASDVGIEPITLDDALPSSPQAQYLQYHYTVPHLGDPTALAPVDPGDGSAYTDTNVAVDEFMKTVSAGFGGGDVMLVDPTGNVVYTLLKRIDLGTNLRTGAVDSDALAAAVLDRLPRTRSGDAISTDYVVYVPAGARPVLFATAEIRKDDRVIGALVVEIASSVLTAIANPTEPNDAAAADAEGEPTFDGIESYIVGRDQVLQTVPLSWQHDQARYLDQIDDAQQRTLIETLGSPVGIQRIDTEPVTTALDGGDFAGRSTNLLGQRSYTYATPLHDTTIGWVVVTDTPLSQVQQPLNDYVRKILIVSLVVVIGAAAVGLLMARRLSRPVAPALAAARNVAAGDRSPDLATDGRDEFGDLARRLKAMASQLDAEERALAAAYESKRELLLAVLPASLVADDGAIGGTGETTEFATAVAVSLDIQRDPTRTDQHDAVEVLAAAAARSESIAAELGLQRIRVAADRQLFLASSGDATGDGDRGAPAAAAFALAIVDAVRELAAGDDLDLSVRVGLASGAVATGVLDGGSLTFGAWGEPVRRALAIGALATSGEILVDESAATLVSGAAGGLTPATDIVDLDGEPMVLFSLSAQ